MSSNISKLLYRRGINQPLLDAFRHRQLSEGTSSKPLIKKLATEYQIGEAQVAASVSFYDRTESADDPKKLALCNGTACLCADPDGQLLKSLQQRKGDETTGEVTCLGHCYAGYAYLDRGQPHSGDPTPPKEPKAENALNDHLVRSSLKTPLLTSAPLSIDRVDELIGTIITWEPQQLLDEILASGVRGYGGAGYPTGVKWESCMRVESTRKYIICNADEGDPGAFSDRYLLESQPLSVLTGIILAGRIVGASTGIIYLRDEYPHAHSTLEKAISALRSAGLIGERINRSSFDFDIKIVLGAGAYICGEETALIASIEGRRPEVAVRPPYPTESGLFGFPTVVNNVETFAATTAVLQKGGKKFAQLGTDHSTGTKLISLSSLFNHPGIVEVEMGTPLDDLLYRWGGGFSVPVKAIQVGGPLGGVIRTDQTSELTIDYESFVDNRVHLGHGSIVAIPESMPMTRFIHHLFSFVAHESCGKCFPCRLGSLRGAEMFAYALNGSLLNPQLLDDLLLTLEEGSLCGLGGGIPLPVKNIMDQFPDELSWENGGSK